MLMKTYSTARDKMKLCIGASLSLFRLGGIFDDYPNAPASEELEKISYKTII